MKNSYKEIAEKLAGLDHIVILPHVNMDGDALGSSSALCVALKSKGKNAVIVTDEAIPANLDFPAGLPAGIGHHGGLLRNEPNSGPRGNL